MDNYILSQAKEFFSGNIIISVIAIKSHVKISFTRIRLLLRLMRYKDTRRFGPT